MPATDWGWLITPAELAAWVVVNNPDVLVINKPGGVVCHPSKHGPWSSLVGACREYLGLDQLHMPSRLDRETSGVVVFAKSRAVASRLQRAIQDRRVAKTYYGILSGTLTTAQTVDAPLGRDVKSGFYCRQWVIPDGAAARTHFEPISQGAGYNLVRIRPETGRMHQIRVHASYMGHAVAGDKLYGPDETLMLAFLTEGFSERLASVLPLPRHALHASSLVFSTEAGEETFCAPLAEDFVAFCAAHGLTTAAAADCS